MSKHHFLDTSKPYTPAGSRYNYHTHNQYINDSPYNQDIQPWEVGIPESTGTNKIPQKTTDDLPPATSSGGSTLLADGDVWEDEPLKGTIILPSSHPHSNSLVEDIQEAAQETWDFVKKTEDDIANHDGPGITTIMESAIVVGGLIALVMLGKEIGL